jgi:hypothetical protein
LRTESLTHIGRNLTSMCGTRNGRQATLVPSGCLALIAVFCSTGMLSAQATTAAAVGTVTDASGAVVPGAVITLLDLDTRDKRVSTSNSEGQFVFNLLGPNHYSLTATHKGFQTLTIPSFALSAGDNAREDVHLVVGTEAQVVEVQAQEPALQTDTSVLTHIITDKATQDLPLNGRNYINLVQVSPGATEGPNNGLSSGNRPDDRRQTSSVSVNGQSDVINDQMIDGMDNNERVIGSIGVRPSVDAIQEVRIQTNVFTADVGRSAGAVINVITKSGTDKLHGTAYEFFRNTVLNANPYDFGQDLPKPAYHQNQFGGSLGGPIRKDKTFFFGDYEGLRLVRKLNPTQTTVPTAFERADVGNFTDNSAIDTVVPASSFDPIGLQYFNLFPMPTSTAFANNYTVTPSDSQFSTTFDGRVDQHFNDTNTFFARYTYNAVTTDIGGLFPNVSEAGVTIAPGGNLSSYAGAAKDDAQQVQLDYVHVFTSNLILDLKAGYTYLNNTQYPQNYGTNVNQAFGQPNINIGELNSGLAPVSINAQVGNLGGHTPITYSENTYQYMGALTWTHGKHNTRFGAGFLRRQNTVIQPDNGKGNWTFNTYADLLSGTYATVGRTNILVLPHYRAWEPHVYAQDDWRIVPNLTLNLGIRYDVYTPYTEIKNQLSNFDTGLAKIVVAGQDGVSDHANIRTDYSNVAPRVGFAWTAAPLTVIRGGFGISFAPENMTSGAAIVNQPFSSSFGTCTPTVCSVPGYSTFADGVPLPVPSSAANPSGSVLAAENPHFKSTYIEQFNLTIEKEFGGNIATISYVGELGHRLAYYVSDYNDAPPNSESFVDPTAAVLKVSTFNYNTLRHYYAEVPNLTSIPYWTSQGNSNYNALQAVVQRRLKNGLDFQANYTWAHGLDDSETISQDGSDGFGSVPSLIPTLEYGSSNLNVTNRIAATVDYALPFGNDFSGLKAELAKGWQLNGIYVWDTGTPFSITNSSNRSGTRPGTSNTDRPDQIKTATLSRRTVAKWFDTSSFVGQVGGQIGSERRDQVYGPHFQHLDLSLFKTFPLTSQVSLEFRMEAFNVANSVNFADPGASLGASGFGTISSTANAYNPRLIQFAVKLQF